MLRDTEDGRVLLLNVEVIEELERDGAKGNAKKADLLPSLANERGRGRERSKGYVSNGE